MNGIEAVEYKMLHLDFNECCKKFDNISWTCVLSYFRCASSDGYVSVPGTKK